ncbi:FMN-binding glutamate synthase family protein [Flavobacterium kingsejongi]|uniref:FMN-binding glutamate synthase family protein n=1 Tax=Flavobacterium kingsejongi TaxID=1678728 RepID=A0A2S1LPQ0_9FLAO|nr:FMN-binding glutamate synthase family protein [Flavobacterium kingsejongi]AWG25733.1 FMN-binding glutamate synthase family protein [Flavobacterium kingsejongi]
MLLKKFRETLVARQIIWFVTLSALFAFTYMVYHHLLHIGFLGLVLIALAFVVFDTFQAKHSIRKNYPLIGRLRYFFESVRPEFRQYFIEGELDGKPFNRRQRSIVYQRAKNVKQTISFGMQDDPNRIGYEWAAHSIYPKRADKNFFRTTIGNSQCQQPYSASIYNISAMSYGALSKTAISALNKGAQRGGFAHNTGEGGISDFHLQGGDLIWQIGTGYFGCRNEDGSFSGELFAERASYPQVKMIELKLSQGAKPGHGGLLPGEKNTPEIARIRSIKPFVAVHSPSSHTAFSNSTELLYFLKRLRELSQGKPVGFKICIGRKDEFIAIVEAITATGIIPDFITIDGAEGGTGAAPLEFIDYMGMALADALIFATNTLKEYGVREEIKVLSSGKIISAFDIAKAMALGADACYSARGMMFALGCIQALQCDSGKCPVGIATQDKSLYRGLDITDKSVRVAHFHNNTMKAFADFIGACGFENPKLITPDVFYRRVDHKTNLSFAEMYFQEKTTEKKEFINF